MEYPNPTNKVTTLPCPSSPRVLIDDMVLRGKRMPTCECYGLGWFVLIHVKLSWYFLGMRTNTLEPLGKCNRRGSYRLGMRGELRAGACGEMLKGVVSNDSQLSLEEGLYIDSGEKGGPFWINIWLCQVYSSLWFHSFDTLIVRNDERSMLIDKGD